MTNRIKFGTDGWRGIVGDDFTYEEVRRCALGTAAHLKDLRGKTPTLIVGYDTRFSSELFAREVVKATTAMRLETILTDKSCPTPVVSFSVVDQHASGGVVITASHNPAEWNGFKVKSSAGSSVNAHFVDILERRINGMIVDMHPLDDNLQIEEFDPVPSYLNHVSDLVDIDRIKNAGLLVATDAMHGSGAGYFDMLLEGGSTTVSEIRGERNPSFPGMSQPEPIGSNLKRLSHNVRSWEANVGLALDGDADRLGVVDENGRYLSTLDIFALLCYHQLEVLGRRGSIVRSLTSTSMIDRLGEAYKVPVFVTKVGFQHVGAMMQQDNSLIAGEESGGYAFRDHIPERDGIVSGLMILDLLVRTGRTLTDLLTELRATFGKHFYDRIDVKSDFMDKDQIQNAILREDPEEIGGRAIEDIDTQDGIRYVLEGGYWALIRFSGTEPLLRLYAEGESTQEVKAFLDDLKRLALLR